MLKSYPMAALDSHTVTSSSLKTVFDNNDDLSSLTTTCACRASSPAICKCSQSQSLNSLRGRESATKDLSSTDNAPPSEPQPARLTLKLTLPSHSKQPKQSVPTLATSFPAVPTASPIPHLQEQTTPPQRKRGRGRPRKLAHEISATHSSHHNTKKPPSRSTLPTNASSRSFTKPGTVRVKPGTATSNPRPRRRRSSSNFSDTVPRRHRHDSSAHITHQQPAYPLFLPASVLSSGDLSSSSVTLSESSDTDDQCESSPSPVSLSLSLSIGNEQADRGHTHHQQHSYDQQLHLERARVRRELLGHDQSPPHQQQQHHSHNHNHDHNQQNNARAHHPPQQHPTAGGGRSSSGDETEDERSSSGDIGSSDSDDGTESDDGDPNITDNPHPKLTTRFHAAPIEIDPDSETESEIDAELFFSNLIKSASSSSSDDDSDDSDDGNADADEVMLDVEIDVEIPGTGGDGDNEEDEVNDDGGGGDNGNDNDNGEEAQRWLGDPAMMVREGWDGALVFATDIGTQGRGGVLDAAYERSSSWSRERAPSVPRMHPHARHTHTHTSTYAGPTTARTGRRTMSVSSGLNLPLDVIAELQTAAETTLLGTRLMPSMSLSIMDSGSALSDTEEGGRVGEGGGDDEDDDETDGGETTDDELPFVPLPGMEGMGGVGMRFLLPPTAPPVLSVNPDVTMSPITSKRTNSKNEFAVGESPRPAEILQRQQMQMQMQRRWTTSGEGPTLTDAPQALNNSIDSPEKPSLPKMGVFGPPGHANGLGLSTSSKAGVVIGKQTAKGSIPSPFAKLTRNTGPDVGSAGGCTPTTPSLPARGRKRRASVSVCCFPHLSHSNNFLVAAVGPHTVLQQTLHAVPHDGCGHVQLIPPTTHAPHVWRRPLPLEPG